MTYPRQKKKSHNKSKEDTTKEESGIGLGESTMQRNRYWERLLDRSSRSCCHGSAKRWKRRPGGTPSDKWPTSDSVNLLYFLFVWQFAAFVINNWRKVLQNGQENSRCTWSGVVEVPRHKTCFPIGWWLLSAWLLLQFLLVVHSGDRGLLDLDGGQTLAWWKHHLTFLPAE